MDEKELLAALMAKAAKASAAEIAEADRFRTESRHRAAELLAKSLLGECLVESKNSQGLAIRSHVAVSIATMTQLECIGTIAALLELLTRIVVVEHGGSWEEVHQVLTTKAPLLPRFWNVDATKEADLLNDLDWTTPSA